MDKFEARARMRALRLRMDGAKHAEYSRLIVERALEMPEYQAAQTVMAYAATRGEADLDALLRQALLSGKALYLPRVLDSAHMQAVRVRSLDELKPGAWGILEPTGQDTMGPEGIELFLTPGVAFDRDGARVGYGAGYYDRFLRGSRGVRVGIAFEAQLLTELTVDEHDVRMDAVLTERARYDTTCGRAT